MANTPTSFSSYLRSVPPEDLEQVVANTSTAVPTQADVPAQPADVPAQPAAPTEPAVVPAQPAVPGHYQSLVSTQGDDVAQSLQGIRNPDQRSLAVTSAKADLVDQSADSLGRQADELGVISADLNKHYDEGQAKVDAQTADMMQEHKENQARVQEAQSNNDRDYQTLMQPEVEIPRWKKVVSGIVNVLGAVGAASGSVDGAGLAAAMGLIDGKLHEEIIEQGRAKSSAQKRMEASNSRLDQVHDDDVANINFTTQLGANIYNRAANEALQAANNADSVTKRESLLRGADELHLKRLDLIKEGAEAEIAARARARAAGAAGQNARAKAVHQQFEDRLKVRELELKERAAAGTSTNQDIPGYVRTKSIDSAQVTKANAAASATAIMNAGLDRLAKLRELALAARTGSSDRSAYEAEANLLIANLADPASQIVGGGQAGEDAKKKYLESIPNPTQWDIPGRTDPLVMYRAMRQQNLRARDATLASMGYAPDPNRRTETEDDPSKFAPITEAPRSLTGGSLAPAANEADIVRGVRQQVQAQSVEDQLLDWQKKPRSH